MYSMVLFMVETSFSGFFGSGEIPTSAVERMADTSASGMRPVKVTIVGEVEAMAQRDQVVEAVAGPDEGEADVATSESVHDVIGHLQDEVDAVLRPHHTQVGGQMRPGAPKISVPPPCDVSRRQIRARADDGHRSSGRRRRARRTICR